MCQSVISFLESLLLVKATFSNYINFYFVKHLNFASYLKKPWSSNLFFMVVFSPKRLFIAPMVEPLLLYKPIYFMLKRLFKTGMKLLIRFQATPSETEFFLIANII